MTRTILLLATLLGCTATHTTCYEAPTEPTEECNEGHYLERPECVRYYVDRRVSRVAGWLDCGCMPRMTEGQNGYCDQSRYGEILSALDEVETCDDIFEVDYSTCTD